jgi:tRNA threonylcarbamoyladenosine biosynthesis protein TsaE
MDRKAVTRSERETAALGRELSERLGPGSVILLSGDLGAGKTALVRGIAEGLGASADEVTSPTFTLIQEYKGGRVPLVHVDLYRLNDPREIHDLGLEELGAETVLAIEWAEKLPAPVPGAVAVTIAHGEGDERTIEIAR